MWFRKKKIACIIPARLASSRLEKKMLKSIAGKPILQWIWETATTWHLFDEVVFAVDGPILQQWVSRFGGKAITTPPELENGTARVAYVRGAGLVKADIWVNWQGDQPFIDHEMLRDLLRPIEEPFDVLTLKREITDLKSALDPNIVKVVCNKKGEALYFSRSMVPYNRLPEHAVPHYKHVGLYAYSEKALGKIAGFSVSPLARAESLEQLTFLDEGLKIFVSETKKDTIEIDTKADMERAEMYASGLILPDNSCILPVSL
ncbi:MAG: hypothetical protein A3F09_00125 [Chlamydiae bacterium RIFCSPHIGHO2_12_FULL_49_11]|nr:MAG: hypothetical protein A3F09_00125 [Chlamydiae bacterium RIFCSPHIGHO2_12_FULL_49_11]